MAARKCRIDETMSDAKPEQAPVTTDNTEATDGRARRTRVLKKGKIVFQGGLRSLPCIVRNLSDGGALLQFEQAFLLPAQFDLHIDLENFEVTCEKRWEDGLKCGVQFIGEKRQVMAQRAQILKTSENALTTETNTNQESLDDFFVRRAREQKDGQQQRQQGLAQPQPTRRTRPAGSGKPGFGKRR